MKRAPRVTVLLCVHNGLPYLREALVSILAQSYPDFELLVVDDASTDGSAQEVLALADDRVRLLQNEKNLGLTRSLNRGLAEARGELVARQDSDDASWPRRLERQVAFLDAHPRAAVVGAQARIIDARGRRVPGARWGRCTTGLGVRWQLMFDSPLVHTAAMFRRGVVWDQLGGYDETFPTSQDFELWSRVARLHEVRNLAETLVDFRATPGSVSSRYSRDRLANVAGVLRRNLCDFLQLDEPPEEWLDLWVRVNNIRAFGAPAHGGDCAKWLRWIRSRFLSLHPEARAKPEIRRHLAQTAARLACNLVPFDRRAGATLFATALRANPVAAAPFSARFLALAAPGVQRLRGQNSSG